MSIVDFAPIFDFNYSFLSSLTMEDLANWRESLVKYDVGPKLGGSFGALGRALVTDEIRERLPSVLKMPRHGRYNMDPDRMQLLEDIFQENYAYIRGKNSIKVIDCFS